MGVCWIVFCSIVPCFVALYHPLVCSIQSLIILFHPITHYSLPPIRPRGMITIRTNDHTLNHTNRTNPILRAAGTSWKYGTCRCGPSAVRASACRHRESRVDSPGFAGPTGNTSPSSTCSWMYAHTDLMYYDGTRRTNPPRDDCTFPFR